MTFAKKVRLYTGVLVVLICVSIAAFLIIQVTRTGEPKTVYVLPDPNPRRAEILKHALQPQRHANTTLSWDSVRERTLTGVDTSSASVSSSEADSLSYDNEPYDPEYMADLLELDGTNDQNSDFPPLPEGFPYPPVWIRIPGYQKGDMPDVELIGRVLVELWNRGLRGFESGAYSGGKVYPLYDDVMYVKWAYTENGILHIKKSLGRLERHFYLDDFIEGTWRNKYPGVEFIPFDEAGYDPYTILNDD